MADAREMAARIEAFLASRHDRGGGAARVVEVIPITGGYSRQMSRVVVEDDHGQVGYIIRADPPPGQSILDTDRTVEWTVLSAIAEHGTVRMPGVRWFDQTGEHLGSPAIVLDQVMGEGLNTLSQRGDREGNKAFTDRLAGALASVHTFDLTKLPAIMERPRSWDEYLDGCIASWHAAEAAHVEHDPFMRVVGAWLEANRPPEAPLMLVHGDFQTPNVLVERDSGHFHLIDWELTHIGDPREDLGWWVLASASQPPDLIADDEEAFFSRYRELTGLSAEVVNPATVAYFTVMASANVFFSLIRQTSLMTRGETNAMGIAYMTNAMPFMHGVWIDSMRKAGAWGKGGAK